MLNGQSFRLIYLFRGAQFTQTFRWNKVICPSDKTSVFVGVAKHRVWKLWRQNDNEIGFKVLNNFQQRSANIKGTENKVIQGKLSKIFLVPLEHCFTANKFLIKLTDFR